MNMKRSSSFLRLLCICFVLILSLTMFCSCQSHPLKASKQALQVVGTVGNYEVLYEELYFLASNYKTDGITNEELWETVSENIISNYAILTLCDMYGVKYDEDELEDYVQEYIDSTIEADFLGSRRNYIDALEESYMTDHFVRFTAEVDMLYDNLASTMATAGDIITDEDTVTEYIKNNFIRTWHLMIANNTGDDASANLTNAQNALADLKAGNTTMYKLIGSSLNEDLLITIDGYSFGKGSMEQAYENASFALEVGEYSDVVSAKGELASGEYVDCYYVIQRLALDDAYIRENFSKLYESYESTIIAQKLAEVKSTLTFTPNDYGSSLDLLNLEKIDAGIDTFAFVIAGICIGIVAAIALVTVLIVRHIKKKHERRLADAKAKKAILEKKGKQ